MATATSAPAHAVAPAVPQRGAQAAPARHHPSASDRPARRRDRGVPRHGRGRRRAGQRRLGYLQAAAEASMVGGLADWFAVVALFRHPLGLPIPHTAIITERKEQFGETLGEFIQDSFLTPDAVAERVQPAGVGDRVATLAGRAQQRRAPGRPRARRRGGGGGPPRGRRRPRRARAASYASASSPRPLVPDGRPCARRPHPGGPPQRGGRRRAAGPRPLPRRAP